MQIRILSMTARNGGAEILLRIELCEDVFDAMEASASQLRMPAREIRELTLLADRYMELRPTKGIIDEEAFLALEEADAFSTAVRSGLRMLSFGSNTKKGLVHKLAQKGIARETAEDAAAYLEMRGYISEIEDAVRDAERSVQKMRGRNRVLAALYEKGYGGEAISAAQRYLDEVDFTEICRTLLRKRYRGVPSDAMGQKKLAATLMRNGFTMPQIREAFRTYDGDDLE